MPRRRRGPGSAVATLAAALALSSCASAPAVDGHVSVRNRIAQEAGLLVEARYPQTGPAVSAHLARGNEPEYEFHGERIVGRIPTRIGELGCILVLPEAQSARGTVFLFHGYLSYGIYVLGLAERLADRGWSVLDMDLPGHGFSDGNRGDIRSFSDYAEAISDLMRWAGSQARFDLPRPFVLLGHSAGGAAVLTKIFDPSAGERPDAAILLAPLVRPVDSWAVPLAGFIAPIVPRVKSTDGDDGYLGVRYIPLSWVRALGQWWPILERAPPSSIPALVVQGTADKVLEWRRNIALLERKLPAAKFILLPEAGHVLPVGGAARDACLAAASDFLDTISKDFP